MEHSFSKEELKEYARNSLAFYGLDLSRISSVFIAQLYRMEKNRVIDIYKVTDEVKYLEGLRNVTSTGNATQFRGEVLKGLYKKHFMDAGFILKNIMNHMGYGKDKTPRLNKIIREAFEKNTSGYADNEFINYIAHHTTVGAYEERAKKALTGEWIIFKKFNGRNYYLTLAAHNEGDENIYSRVRDVYELDYPFLQECA